MIGEKYIFSLKEHASREILVKSLNNEINV